MKKNRKIIFVFLLASFILVSYQIRTVIQSRMTLINDTRISSLVQKIPFPADFSTRELLEHNPVRLTFTAKSYNLYVVAVRFHNPNGILDKIRFRIKKDGAKSWFHESTYKTNLPNAPVYHAFVFPMIPDSKNRTYIIEFESIWGKKDLSVSINQPSDFFLAQYFFSKKIFIRHPNLIAPFIKDKIVSYANNVSLKDLPSFIVLLFLPFVLSIIFAGNDNKRGRIEPEAYKFDVIIGILTLFLSILYLIPINQLIAVLVPHRLNPDFLSKIFSPHVPLGYIKPEPVERMQYIISVFSLPFLCFGFSHVLRKLSKKKFFRHHINYFYAGLTTISYLAILILVYKDMLGTQLPFFYISGSFFFHHRFFGFLAFLLLLGILLIDRIFNRNDLYANISKRIIDGLNLSLIVIVSLLPIINEYSNWHYNAYIYSAVQVFFGKTLLVDLTNLYGFYPYFLELFFKIFGLNTLNFTVLMGILLGISFASIYLLLRNVIRSRLIAFCGFASVVFFIRIVPTLLFPDDFYFQYYPHRLIFPALFALCAYLYFLSKPRKKELWYHGIFFLSTIAVFWNMDTGIVIFLTWLAVLGYQELIRRAQNKKKKFLRNIFIHFLTGFSYLCVVTLLFLSYTFSRSGRIPNLGYAFSNMNVFYGMGYGFLPMKLIHPWNLVLLCYVIGLIVSIQSVVQRSAPDSTKLTKTAFSREKMIFLLSVMGFGLFSHYQGRSHDNNLVTASWPIFLLLTIFTDIIYTKLLFLFTLKKGRKENYFKFIKENSPEFLIFLILFFFLSSSIPSVIFHARDLGVFFQKKIKYIKTYPGSELKRNIDFVVSNTSPGDTVFFLTRNDDAIYYINSRTTNPIPVPGMIELFLRKDYETMIYYFSNKRVKKIFVDNEEIDAKIMDVINNFYTPTLISKDKNLRMYLIKK